jgi:hypothetical protein
VSQPKLLSTRRNGYEQRYVDDLGLLVWFGVGNYVNDKDSSGRVVSGVDMRSLACGNCRFESRRGHGYPSVVSVVGFQSKTSPRRDDHTSRRVLPSVVRPVSVIVKPRKGRP